MACMQTLSESDPLRGADAPPPSRFAFGHAVVLGYVLVAVVYVLAVLQEFAHIESSANALARERGFVLFRLIELTRDWNAQHGGVYVRVTDSMQPNPYLEHPRRDLVTTDGTRLTMVNPAFMTRQIAEIAEQADGVHFHITSLNPIRPANAPDDWERGALTDFEVDGVKERLALISEGERPVHRYMAPLFVKKACLYCHEKQGYKIGDIRGGISVTMPAEATLRVMAKQRTRTLLTYGIAALLIAVLLHLIAWRTYRHVRELRHIARTQEQLVRERTQELSDRNTQLRDEIEVRQRKEAEIVESEARYRSVIQTSQDAILIVAAPEFRIGFANAKAAALFAQTPGQLRGQCLADLLLDETSASLDEWLSGAEGPHVPPPHRLFQLRQGSAGALRTVEAYGAPIISDGTGQWVVNMHDISDQLIAQRKLKISAAVMDNAAEGIMVTDADNRIIDVNPAFTAITGYRPAEVLGRNPRILGSGRHGPEFFRNMWDALARDASWQGEIWNRRRDGTVYPQWLAITTIGDTDGHAGGRYVATFSDITQRKEAEEVLRHKAHTDPLTELPNRALFYDRLLMVFSQAKRYEETFALLYLDLDYFKEVNDQLGHAAGDALLVEAARRLVQAIRDSDTVARLGGDEFAIILPKLTHDGEAEEVAERIVRSLAEPFLLDGQRAEISCSIGIAIYPTHASEVDLLKRCADAALYQVKRNGRNGYQVYSPGLGEV